MKTKGLFSGYINQNARSVEVLYRGGRFVFPVPEGFTGEFVLRLEAGGLVFAEQRESGAADPRPALKEGT